MSAIFVFDLFVFSKSHEEATEVVEYDFREVLLRLHYPQVPYELDGYTYTLVSDLRDWVLPYVENWQIEVFVNSSKEMSFWARTEAGQPTPLHGLKLRGQVKLVLSDEDWKSVLDGGEAMSDAPEKDAEMFWVIIDPKDVVAWIPEAINDLGNKRFGYFIDSSRFGYFWHLLDVRVTNWIIDKEDE